MNIKRVMIAAPKSGSGKTMITCALLQALKDCGESVVSFKCGPDYIDPMFHQKILGIPSKNLDTFFTGEEKTKSLFLQDRKENEFALIEGVMGLYDGLSGIREEGSSYHLAKITKTPIILVVDAKGMGRSILAVIKGFLDYDKSNLIKGVLLNRISKSYYEMIAGLITKELKIEVVGYFPEQKDLRIESRHLGLQLPNEIEHIQNRVQKAAKELVKTVSIDQISQIATLTDDLTVEKEEKKAKIIENSPKIAVAKDEAFCFYYEDNLALLRELGATLVYFSPLRDAKVPNDIDAILLGGGYPELYAETLSHNFTMQKSIQSAFQKGMPIVAECGGFMYLHENIVTQEGKNFPMVGIVRGTCEFKGKLVRFGYIELKEKSCEYLEKDSVIKGHEFHYFDSTDNGEDCIAKKPFAYKEYTCVHEDNHCFLGFPHLYYPSNPSFAENFIKKASIYKMKKESC